VSKESNDDRGPVNVHRTLRTLRAGLTQAEAGALAGISQRRLSRIETRYVPTEDEVKSLLRVYKASPDTRRLLLAALADLASEVTPARTVLARSQMEAFQQRVRRIERNADHIRSFQPSMIIGLLQTEAFVRAVFNRGNPADAEGAIEARRKRQAALADKGRQYTLIQSEGSLDWMLGSPQLMADQMDHLAEMATRWPERVRVGVIRWSTPMPFYVLHGVHIYDHSSAMVGTRSGTTIFTNAGDVDDYAAQFAELEKRTTWGDEAAATFTEHADRYKVLVR
jgi:transcriptional regulator with XRE-family HTH domain